MDIVSINKKTVWQNIRGIVFIMLSVIFQIYYLFGFMDQGYFYSATKNGEIVIYLFNAFVYLYYFWQICNKQKSKLIYVVTALTPMIYALQVAAYHVLLRFSLTDTSKTASECFNAYFSAFKEYVLTSPVKYIIPFFLMMAICIFIAVISPKYICHKIHKFKISWYKRHNETASTLYRITENYVIVKRGVGGNLVLRKESEEDETANLEYMISFLVINWSVRGKDYLVFSNLDEGADGCFSYYVGEYDRKNKRLYPVRDVSDFDKIEKIVLTH